MASLIILIRSVLDDLQLLKDMSDNQIFILLMRKLRILCTFLLCTKDMQMRSDDMNINEDGSLGPFLVKIQDLVSRNSQKIRTYCLGLAEGFPEGVVDQVSHFNDDFLYFMKEIGECCITLSDCWRQSSPPTTDGVVEIIDSLLYNAVEIIDWDETRSSGLVELLQALQDKLIFLKNFIRFSTLRGIEHKELEDLLTHIEAVVVNETRLYVYRFTQYGSSHLMQIKRQTPELLQNMKLIEPHVYESYIRALHNSKLSRQPFTLDMDDGPLNIMKDFIHSLACNLWEMLQLDARLVVPMKEQLQVLYEGLRFLRSMLREQPNKFAEKIGELTGDVICDAGVIILSLSQKDVQIDLGILDLLDRIKVIRAEVEEKVPGTSTFNFPKTNELGFLDSLLETLRELTKCKIDSNGQIDVQTILQELDFLISFLKEIVQRRHQQQELQALWNRVVEVAYRVEFFIDLLLVGDIPDSFSTSFQSITEDIRNIRADILKIPYSNKQDIKVKEATTAPSHVPPQSSAPISSEVVGYNDEVKSIIARLRRGSKQLRIVAIVGMPGQGKTTLATKVYNDPSTTHHFHIRAWCSISQVYDRKKVLLQLLSQILKKLPDVYLEKTEQDLSEELWHRLKGSRYLIFLDDVWDIKAWNSLEESLPDDSRESRIILTSRRHDVVPEAKLDEKPLFLRQLTDNESFELLQRKLFPGKGWPAASYGLGRQIAENCNGLPLTIIIVAGLLASMKQENWKEVLESLSSGSVSSTEQCKNTMELSYKNLPDYLKPCFLYFGVFPEDQELSIKRLVWLWIAEGFVRKVESKSLEDVGTDYLVDLMGRSLVMVTRQRSIGGNKACRIHDLLHDFCMAKAKEEEFFQQLKGCDELVAFNEPGNLRRLCIYSEPEHFQESRLFCPRLRSLIFFDKAVGKIQYPFDVSFIINIFKLLTVLGIGESDLGDVFPSAIAVLVLLKYLSVRGRFKAIPPSIGNLSNLETFIVNPLGKGVPLPDTFWNLQKLRHVHVILGRSFFSFGLFLPTKNLDNSFLYHLDSFSGAVISWDHMEKQMRKFPNIRKLKFKLLDFWNNVQNCINILVPDFLNLLESLNVSSVYPVPDDIELEFGISENLKKLTLSGLELPWSKISVIQKFPNLQVLKLLSRSFSGETWNMEEEHFSNLTFLELSSLDIVRWTACDDQFPSLKKLVLEDCNQLEEIPSCLESSSTLEMIEVTNCPDTIVSLVKQIRDVQMDMVKILIQSSK